MPFRCLSDAFQMQVISRRLVELLKYRSRVIIEDIDMDIDENKRKEINFQICSGIFPIIPDLSNYSLSLYNHYISHRMPWL
jgi:hypothetical protein